MTTARPLESFPLDVITPRSILVPESVSLAGGEEIMLGFVIRITAFRDPDLTAGSVRTTAGNLDPGDGIENVRPGAGA